jgi:hypothetical protein
MLIREVAERVAGEVDRIGDENVSRELRKILVEPYAVERPWDYGAPGEAYECWTVAEHRPSNTAIAYCEKGFGPASPWGLVAIAGDYIGMGMDSGWFRTLEDAFRDSFAWQGS